MALKVAFQMDHIRSINIESDSTFALALEAQKRGYALHHYLPRQLVFSGGRLTATAEPLQVRRKRGDHFTLGAPRVIDLSQMDVVMLRQDPPFDMGYITTTHLLEHVHPKTLVVNDPKEVRNAPEKLYVTRFADLMPPTLITSERDAIIAFREAHKDIILKPLFGNGGAGVFHVSPKDENMNALLEMFTQFYREPIIAQKYLPEVRKGDKRIILIDGEAAGVINRVPAKGEARANMHVGARPKKASLSKRDREICAAIGPDLKARGLIFVGIDVIGEYLTEVNVTSPTGIQEIDRFDKVNLEARVWDAIEKKLKKSRR
jgi:glutathione synthase